MLRGILGRGRRCDYVNPQEFKSSPWTTSSKSQNLDHENQLICFCYAMRILAPSQLGTQLVSVNFRDLRLMLGGEAYKVNKFPTWVKSFAATVLHGV